jgi:hypothetical protein
MIKIIKRSVKADYRGIYLINCTISFTLDFHWISLFLVIPPLLLYKRLSTRHFLTHKQLIYENDPFGRLLHFVGDSL